MPKFTKGPWHRNIKPAKKYPTIFAGRNKHIATLQSQGLSDEEVEANCDLIKAAPTLFDELEHLVKLLEPLEAEGKLQVPGLATLNGARAALNAALGRE